MDTEEIKDDVIENENESENEDKREEETVDEIRDEDYVNDDEIEMDRSIEDKLDKVMGKLDSIFDTISMFVDSGAVIREANPNDVVTESDDDFAEEFMTIDELDWSID